MLENVSTDHVKKSWCNNYNFMKGVTFLKIDFGQFLTYV